MIYTICNERLFLTQKPMSPLIGSSYGDKQAKILRIPIKNASGVANINDEIF